MASAVNTQPRDRVQMEEGAIEKISQGIDQAFLGFFIMSAGLVGIWGMALLVSAIAQSGGVIGLARNWLAAVTGV